MSRPFWLVFAPALALAACNGKRESAASPAADSTAAPSAPALADSTAKPAGDSVAKPSGNAAPAKPVTPAAKPAAGKAETTDYDQAIRPKFKIDEKTGKIDTIKRP